MYACMYVYMYNHEYICRYMNVSIYVCICTYIYVGISIHKHTHKHTQTHIKYICTGDMHASVLVSPQLKASYTSSSRPHTQIAQGLIH
jgi:hypothetical protein